MNNYTGNMRQSPDNLSEPYHLGYDNIGVKEYEKPVIKKVHKFVKSNKKEISPTNDPLRKIQNGFFNQGFKKD